MEGVPPQNRINAPSLLEETAGAVCARPWGSFQSLTMGTRHQVKHIIVEPGKRLSLQSHHHRAEHWIVVRGTALVVINDTDRLLYENQSVYIPVGAVHRLENPGKITLEIIEVQTGTYLGEDDIIRLQDDFHRIYEPQRLSPPQYTGALPFFAAVSEHK